MGQMVTFAGQRNGARLLMLYAHIVRYSREYLNFMTLKQKLDLTGGRLCLNPTSCSAVMIRGCYHPA